MNNCPKCNEPFALEVCSLRDWFAGQALAGLCADGWVATDASGEQTAKVAYRLADQMLKEREKKP